MTVDIIPVLLALLSGSFIGNAISVFMALAKKRKMKSETDLTTVEAAKQVVDLYGRALKQLEEKVESLEREIVCLKNENQHLLAEIESLRVENRELQNYAKSA